MCIFGKRGVHILIIPQERKRKAAKSVHPKMRTTLRPCILFSDLDLRAVVENEGDLADSVEKHSFYVKKPVCFFWEICLFNFNI